MGHTFGDYPCHSAGLETVLSYRHRAITNSDVIFIRKFITEHTDSSRRDLSKKLCQAWSGIQANGC